MFFKFNKLSAFITLGCLSASALAFSGPPGNEISNIGLSIDNNEGTIYANGNMQAKLHVQYQLAEGAQLKQITILDRNTRQPLQDSPSWFVDTEENEYLHVISYSSRSSTELPTSKTSNVYVNRYIRASRIDNVDLCVKIETVSGSVKDNCTDGAPVYLQAIAPVVINGSDFELQHVKTIISNDHRHMQQKYLKVRDPRLAPGLRVEFMQTDANSDGFYNLDSGYNAVRDYQLWEFDSTYVGAWLFKPNDFNKVRYNSLGGNAIESTLTHSSDSSIVAEVIHYETHELRILAGRRECWLYTSDYYVCTGSDYDGTVEYVPISNIDGFIKDKLPSTSPSSQINVTDQYGNQGYFILDYPNGGDDLVLR
ncbi:hypothetical protein HGG78_18020 [Vibrio aestuarianus]|uniref:hypothetical protein n=1 Tax=Vibrio aestuarianus TaxID=28171 RepID=UPI001558FFB2|nr:hypothetical protein [Vibrio aestuarianus]NGZ15614.1 hypothetical protein [Vibrio aestuarianus]NKZ51762.1 hypothetical protein [Vibrio aestuarianus]